MNVFDACKLLVIKIKSQTKTRNYGDYSKDLKSRVLVWTNGVFDILHEGHFELLKFAKQQGDELIVGINSDTSVKRLRAKTDQLCQEERMSQLKTLPWVDRVVIFEEDTPFNMIKNINQIYYKRRAIP